MRSVSAKRMQELLRLRQSLSTRLELTEELALDIIDLRPFAEEQCLKECVRISKCLTKVEEHLSNIRIDPMEYELITCTRELENKLATERAEVEAMIASMVEPKPIENLPVILQVPMTERVAYV